MEILKWFIVILVVVIAGNYKVFWYRTQFWIKNKRKRRPYTYLIRDFYHQAPAPFIGIIVTVSYYSYTWIEFDTVVAIAIGVVGGHLFWGGKYIPGQQEDEEYNPGGKKK